MKLIDFSFGNLKQFLYNINVNNKLNNKQYITTMSYTNEQISAFQSEFNATIAALKGMVNDRVLGRFSVGIYAPLQFIKIDALDPKDYPNNIADNSVFLQFSINYEERKVELRNVGHVYLSPRDLTTPKYKYLAMKGVHNVAEDKGVKKFRKSKFKDANDLAKKIATYYNKVMECVTEYTGGYPYDRGIEE